MLDSDSLIALTKFVGAIFACGLGVIALFGDFRNSQGGLTKSGRATLLGLALSLIAAVVGVILENSKAKNDAKEQSQRTELLLTEVSRAVQPLGATSLQYNFELSSEVPVVAKYIEYIRDKVAVGKLKIDDPVYLNSIGINIVSVGHNGEPLTVDVKRDGQFWPGEEARDLAIFLSSFRPALAFYREPIAPKKFYLVYGGVRDAPDLMLANTDFNYHPTLSYKVKERKLYVSGVINFSEILKYSNGKISSVPDLYGSQFIFWFSLLDVSKIAPHLSKFASSKSLLINESLKIDYVVYNFGSGRKIWLNYSKLLRSNIGDDIVYSFVMPKNDVGLRLLSSYDEGK